MGRKGVIAFPLQRGRWPKGRTEKRAAPPPPRRSAARRARRRAACGADSARRRTSSLVPAGSSPCSAKRSSVGTTFEGPRPGFRPPFRVISDRPSGASERHGAGRSARPARRSGSRARHRHGRSRRRSRRCQGCSMKPARCSCALSSSKRLKRHRPLEPVGPPSRPRKRMILPKPTSARAALRGHAGRSAEELRQRHPLPRPRAAGRKARPGNPLQPVRGTAGARAARRLHRAPDSADAFFASGRADAWREALTAEQAERIVERHGAQMRRFAYL